jgi:predicted lipoprotein with Yx(FWY)xxD motif
MKKLIALLSVLAVAAVSAGAGQASPQAKNRITAAKSRYGTVLFDGKGRVLYGFTRDRRGKPSRCYGACAQAWPVYFKSGGALKAGKGVKQKLIGSVKRKNGRLQVTYNGWPLYYYVNDVNRGQISCQNVNEFGGLWLVVSPKGKLIR